MISWLGRQSVTKRWMNGTSGRWLTASSSVVVSCCSCTCWFFPSPCRFNLQFDTMRQWHVCAMYVQNCDKCTACLNRIFAHEKCFIEIRVNSVGQAHHIALENSNSNMFSTIWNDIYYNKDFLVNLNSTKNFQMLKKERKLLVGIMQPTELVVRSIGRNSSHLDWAASKFHFPPEEFSFIYLSIEITVSWFQSRRFDVCSRSVQVIWTLPCRTW